MRASFILLLLILCQSSAWAALKWERLRADLSPVLNEKSVETEFAFVNEGQVPVTIESIKSSCGCTSAVTGKKTYAPGEKGEVRARFTIGQRRGQWR